MKQLISILLVLTALPLHAQTADSCSVECSFNNEADTLETNISDIPRKKTFLQKVGNTAASVFNYINTVDSSYIRPQEFNWAAMGAVNTYIESYKLEMKSGQEVVFAPESRTTIGPYAGWRWAFLGYTFDIKTLSSNSKKDWSFSFYTPICGIDLMWRKSSDYKIKRAVLSKGVKALTFEDLPLRGMESTSRGFSVDYILNHKKFSYPAAFSQSSCQLKSAGSPVIGIGYLYHKLDIDYKEMETTLVNTVSQRYPVLADYLQIDSTIHFTKLEFGSLSFSGGYAYNYVPLRNLLISGSLTAGIAVKKTFGDIEKEYFSYRDFKFSNLNFDGCGRFAIVYNNMRWFAGCGTIWHYYSYAGEQYRSANMLGSINIYAGINFIRKKEFRKKK